MISFYICAFILLCSPALHAMEDDLYTNAPGTLVTPSAPSANEGNEGDDEQINATVSQNSSDFTELEHLVDAKTPKTLEEWQAYLQRKKIMISLTLNNKTGSPFCSKSMNYDINDDGTCSPREGCKMISWDNSQNNPNPADYATFGALGWENFQKMMIEKQVDARMAAIKRTIYEPCLHPLNVSLDQKTATVLVSLTKDVDGQNSLVVPRTKYTVPLYMNCKEPYTQQFNPTDTEPITLEIKTSIYSN